MVVIPSADCRTANCCFHELCIMHNLVAMQNIMRVRMGRSGQSELNAPGGAYCSSVGGDASTSSLLSEWSVSTLWLSANTVNVDNMASSRP